MKADVLFISRHYPEIIAKGYADSGLLADIFDGKVWTVPGVTYESHEVLGEEWPDVPGAVVVVPARHHASPEDVEWLRERLDRLAWSVVVLAGDEENCYPWEAIGESDTRRLYIMQPRPVHKGLGMLPGGYSPGTHESLAERTTEAAERSLDFSFAGQVTHIRRQMCVNALRHVPNGRVIKTKGYMQGIDIEEYRGLLAGSKVVPCPSGPMTVDTNRPLEAMECGAVPVVDMLTPRGDDEQFDYWALVMPEIPLRKIRDWRKFRDILREIVSTWPKESNRTFAKWIQFKRRLCLEMAADVLRVSGAESELDEPNAQITVLMPTSPLTRHPDTSVIEETLASVRAQLPDAEVIICCDGVRPEQKGLEPAYQEYLRRIIWKCNYEWHNVVPVVLDEWGHQANSARAGLELVRTPQVLFVEHDTPIFGDIDWPGLCEVVAQGDAEHVRLHIYNEIHVEHLRLMVGEVEKVHGVPLQRTFQFWARPHLASTRFYREKVMREFPEESRTMIEDKMHSVCQSAYQDHGLSGWYDYRLWVYCPEGGYMRSGHLDGRAGADKYSMDYTG